MPTRRLLVCAWFAFIPVTSGAMQQPPGPVADSADSGRAELIVRVLDVGQGDATYVENGSSRVIIDGGPSPRRSAATSTLSVSTTPRSMS